MPTHSFASALIARYRAGSGVAAGAEALVPNEVYLRHWRAAAVARVGPGRARRFCRHNCVLPETCVYDPAICPFWPEGIMPGPSPARMALPSAGVVVPFPTRRPSRRRQVALWLRRLWRRDKSTLFAVVVFFAYVYLLGHIGFAAAQGRFP